MAEARDDAPPTPGPRVVVVGGGFSGASVAVHLAGLARAPLAIEVVEPRARLGAGLAYATDDPAHRINVPSVKMSLYPEDEAHFDRWLRASGALGRDPEAVTPDGRAFPCRAVFGRYVAEHVGRAAAAGPATIRHLGTSVLDVTPAETGYRVRLASGAERPADVVVLAPSNPPPAPPAVLDALAGHPRYVADPWARDALAPLRPEDRVLIVGTALTMADVVASLERRGHRGAVAAVSRRGLLSRGHVPPDGTVPAGPGDAAFPAREAEPVTALLARVRRAVREASDAGLPWQGVLDAVRRGGPLLWASLDERDRRRFLRHLRPFWDTHRYRVAPQAERAIRDGVRAGRLTVLAAGLRAAATDDDGAIRVVLRPRRSRAAVTHVFDAVVVATGPGHGRAVEAVPLLGRMAAAGLLRPDAYGLGVAVDRLSRVIDRRGTARDDLLVSGPLARGTVGELMGLPEVAHHAAAVAARVAERLGGGRTAA